MISVLIPVYNQSVVTLVKEVVAQCERVDVPFQVLVFDDGSTQEYKDINKEISHDFGVNYMELSENLGRAKIRNWLAKMARYYNLLFLDGDSTIVRENFIASYLKAAENSNVIYGGRVYQEKKPSEESLVLHWKYGRTREALPAKKRLLNPVLNFQSNNFLIKSDWFAKIKFDADVKGYGYEDLQFAEKLKRQGVNIFHIDNPVQHDGLESSEQFLAKTKNAVKNLVKLNQQGELQNVRLTQFYTKLKKRGGLSMLLYFIKSRQSAISRNLKSSNPSIRYFSFYKLLEYHRLISNKENEN